MKQQSEWIRKGNEFIEQKLVETRGYRFFFLQVITPKMKPIVTSAVLKYQRA